MHDSTPVDAPLRVLVQEAGRPAQEHLVAPKLFDAPVEHVGSHFSGRRRPPLLRRSLQDAARVLFLSALRLAAHPFAYRWSTLRLAAALLLLLRGTTRLRTALLLFLESTLRLAALLSFLLSTLRLAALLLLLESTLRLRAALLLCKALRSRKFRPGERPDH